MVETTEHPANLRTILENMQVVFSAITEAIAWINSDGCVHWSNPSFEHLVGKEHFQVLGAPKLWEKLLIII